MAYRTQKIDSALRALERLRDHVAIRVEKRKAAGEPVQIESAEYEALGIAIEATRHHRASLSVETSPSMALRDLIEALRNGDPRAIDAARFRAEHVLTRMAA